MSPQITLTLFFSYGMSLQEWDTIGIFEREIAIYRKLQSLGILISFVTYGDNDQQYASRLSDIRILSRPKGLPIPVYARLIPIIHATALMKTDVIKTNQINGAQHALRASQFWRKPLIARGGYNWSFHRSQEFGDESPEFRFARQVEQNVFSQADAIVATTPDLINQIVDHFQSTQPKAQVIPNYVETDRFQPMPVDKQYDLIFIGRLVEQKNLSALLQAVAGLDDVNILLIGKGKLEASLKQQFGTLDARIDWIGQVDNTELPKLINQADIYILPSHYEGHPKTLIEAMACGMPVIGGDSPGIRNIIKHGQTGFLTETDVDSIRSAIQRLRNDTELRDTLGNNARQFVLEHYALDRVAQIEIQLIQKVTGKS